VLSIQSRQLSWPRVRLLGAYVITVASAYAAAKSVVGPARPPIHALAILGILLALLAGVSATCTA
jgi:hypothetical protein